ncbi:DeoR/GlpR transcriptional regulator, partial [Streptococcus mutans]|nr:DeoR/GlpR transcriptional regulator [Streptococcus mutans]
AFGGAGIDASGHPLPDDTLAAAKTADAILLAAKVKVLLAEADKFAKHSNYVLASINDFDYFITDKKPSKKIRANLSDKVEIIF